MSYALSARARKRLQQFAPILGGKDADEQEHKVKPGSQRQHLFYVKNTVVDNPVGDFVLGDVITDIIRSDRHDIEYLGLVKDIMNPNEDKVPAKARKFRARYKELLTQQEQDIKNGKRAALEELGLFPDEDAELSELCQLLHGID